MFRCRCQQGQSNSRFSVVIKMKKYIFIALSIIAAAFGASVAVAGTSIPMYRYFNGVDHFYTINYSELGGGNGVYNYEGIPFHVQDNTFHDSGTVALYRLWKDGVHVYETDPNEVTNLMVNFGYRYEGVMGYVSPGSASGWIPCYLFGNGDYRFLTTNKSEGDNAPGYYYISVPFYVQP